VRWEEGMRPCCLAVRTLAGGRVAGGGWIELELVCWQQEGATSNRGSAQIHPRGA
jgi:hypothetical protein